MSDSTLRLHFEEHGRGEPLVILHGMFGSVANWRTLAKRFASDLRVVSVDLRNHGRSAHDPVHSYGSMAADVRELLVALDAQPAIVLGHSMGAKAAMQLAFDHPEIVAALIAVDMAPRAYQGTNDRVLEILHSLDLSAFRSREDVGRALAAEIPDTDVGAFLLMGLRRDREGALAWRFNVEALWRNRRDLAGEVGPGATYCGPTLLLYGQHSDYVSTDDEALVRAKFPLVRMVSIAGAGHWLHADAPDAVVAAVRSFVRGLPEP